MRLATRVCLVSQRGDHPPPMYGGAPPGGEGPTWQPETRKALEENDWTLPESGLPSPAQIRATLPWFLQARPSRACARGGAGTYDAAVERRGPGYHLDHDQDLDPSLQLPLTRASLPPGEGVAVAGLDEPRPKVTASAFRTYHTVLPSHRDFVDALEAALAFAARVSQELGLEIFPYSVFHVFYEPYLVLGGVGIQLLSIALVGILLSGWALTESLRGAAFVVAVPASVTLCTTALMRCWDIPLNPISLVNLAAGAGISVEFSAHLVHRFLSLEGTRAQRTGRALGEVGAALITGITLTKLIGISVLARAQTAIFEVFFFRMYLITVVVGAVHGLVVLPVLLLKFGPPSFRAAAIDKDGEGEMGRTRHGTGMEQKWDVGGGRRNGWSCT